MRYLGYFVTCLSTLTRLAYRMAPHGLRKSHGSMKWGDLLCPRKWGKDWGMISN